LFAPSWPRSIQPPSVPEWCERMAAHHAMIWWKVNSFVTATVERVVFQCQCVAYIEKHGIHGAVLECGSGSSTDVVTSALALLALQSTRRQLYVHDPLADSVEAAKRALMQTNYPWEKMAFLPAQSDTSTVNYIPDPIALLRVRADTAESLTRDFEMLYSRLADGGIAIVDSASRNTIDDFAGKQGIADIQNLDRNSCWFIKRTATAFIRRAG
jgi:hypothetical protein